jgi:hypothetical protein
VDIHKPKPWHSWREFAKEIGTIVLGVLIALGAEQAVEWGHRQHEVAEAREALRDEMVRNVTSFAMNVEEAPCLLKRLDRVGAWVDGGPPPSWDAGSLYGANSSAWDEAKTSAVPHMPLKERIAYDNFYAAVANRQEVSHTERADFSILTRYMVYAHVPQSERERARQDIAATKAQVAVLANVDRDLLQRAQSLDIRPRPFKPASVERLAALCAEAGPGVNYGVAK